LHIFPIAKELGAREVLIPKAAATLSAVGGVFADVSAYFSVSQFTDSRKFDYESVNRELAKLKEQAESFLNRAGVPVEKRRLEFSVEARYGYQVWELSVPIKRASIGNERELAQLIEDFHAIHEKVFAVKDPGQYVEFIYWNVKAIGERVKPQIKEISSNGQDSSNALQNKRLAYFKDLGGMVETPVYRGDRLRAGNKITAPAIIEEPIMTIVVFPGSRVTVTKLGNYFVESE
jgi:N-methylhydantoinase A